MHIKPFLLAIGTATVLAGCSIGNILTPYKLDIPQGNEVTKDQVAQLKEGMTRTQVRFVLGTPLLTDPFHANRWDYIYSDAKGGKLREKLTFHVEFEGDKLKSWEGETLPASKLIKLGTDGASAPMALDEPVAAAAALSSATPVARASAASAVDVAPLK
ncbi:MULTISPECIES: outer membrane protein assembly factor BamE [Silvimonas]|uniref:outer membrane protein assembly factor BamE n=1 Tax=Silvimonas TaxID=300264 RepID=UPI0024B3B8F2|nr:MULTISPECIES: outer membrane protein assembly factor BamE [Silvimonas]MDR3427413.1 outer membrane protein assembly factor BamE [Silvimonas sp.]